MTHKRKSKRGRFGRGLTVAAVAFGAAVPGGGGGVPMQVRQAVLRLGLGYSRHINHQTTVNNHQNDITKPNSAALHCCLCLAAASPPPPPPSKKIKRSKEIFIFIFWVCVCKQRFADSYLARSLRQKCSNNTSFRGGCFGSRRT